MFDVLLGLSAIVNAAIELFTLKEANEIGGRLEEEAKKKEKQPSEKMSEVQDYRTRPPYEPVWDRRHREYVEADERRKAMEEEKRKEELSKESPLALWVMTHDEMLLDVLVSGVHLIPNKELEGMDLDVVSDFLLNAEMVEKVEKLSDGLEVTVR